MYIILTQHGVMAFELAEQRNLIDLARKLNPQQVTQPGHSQNAMPLSEA